MFGLNSVRGAVFALSCAMILANTNPSKAVELGITITPMGVTDFGAGIVPPPTPHGAVVMRSTYYSSSAMMDRFGNEIPNNFHADVETIAFGYLYMTDLELLGGKVGFGGFLPLMNINGALTVSTPIGPLGIEGDDFSIGDIQLMPLAIGWQDQKNFFANAGIIVQAPTGHYDSTRAFNVGVNHWSFSPFLGLTYITDSGFELSGQTSLNFNTVNPATDYTSGVEFRQEFALGQRFDAWTIGAAGYVNQQISDDSGPGSGDGNRARVFAIGPAISFAQPGLPVASFHAYKEFGAKNRPEGYNVALRLAVAF